jgi:hypothetical protein
MRNFFVIFANVIAIESEDIGLLLVKKYGKKPRA